MNKNRFDRRNHVEPNLILEANNMISLIEDSLDEIAVLPYFDDPKRELYSLSSISNILNKAVPVNGVIMHPDFLWLSNAVNWITIAKCLINLVANNAHDFDNTIKAAKRYLELALHELIELVEFFNKKKATK